MYSMSLAAAAAAPTPAAANALALALQSLPKCYDRELDECLNDRPSKTPNCAAIRAGYNATADNKTAIDRALDAMPYCEAGMPTQTIALIAGGSFLVGSIIGILIAKK